jgi:hypothetical protein
MDQEEVPVAPYGKRGAICSIALSVALVWLGTHLSCWGIMVAIHSDMGSTLKELTIVASIIILAGTFGGALFFSDRAVARLNQIYGITRL